MLPAPHFVFSASIEKVIPQLPANIKSSLRKLVAQYCPPLSPVCSNTSPAAVSLMASLSSKSTLPVTIAIRWVTADLASPIYGKLASVYMTDVIAVNGNSSPAATASITPGDVLTINGFPDRSAVVMPPDTSSRGRRPLSDFYSSYERPEATKRRKRTYVCMRFYYIVCACL